MKFTSITALTGAALLSACATTTPIPASMKAGQFVNYTCDGGKRLAARAAADGSTVRIRFEGGYELDHKGAGTYEGDGFKLNTAGGMPELAHDGKIVAKGCKPAA